MNNALRDLVASQHGVIARYQALIPARDASEDAGVAGPYQQVARPGAADLDNNLQLWSVIQRQGLGRLACQECAEALLIHGSTEVVSLASLAPQPG